MTLHDLISAGKSAIHNSITSNEEYLFCEGKAFREWLALSMRFMEQNYPNEKETVRFVELAQNADGKFLSVAENLISILEALEAIPSKPKETPVAETIFKICENFYLFDTSMRRRRAGKPKFVIDDEYDLQDALRSILKLFVLDVRSEEYVPSYAGGNSRVDFRLPEHGIIIETKMASNQLKDKKLGEELMIDYQRYQELSACNHLICFIYDRDLNIDNPHGLIADLERMNNSSMKITVIISPQ